MNLEEELKIIGVIADVFSRYLTNLFKFLG